MKQITILSAVAAAATLLAIPAQANLVVNGNFESGNTGWSFSPNAAIINGPVQAHTGNYYAELGPAIGGINQSISSPTGPGAGQYWLSFWAKDTGASGSSQTVGVFLQNQVIENFDPTTTWTMHTKLVTLAAGSAQLLINWLDGNASAYIDDISLVAVPEPTTMIAGALLLLPFGLSTVRFLRNRATA